MKTMIAQFRNRTTVIWLILVAITAISWETSVGHADADRFVTLAVLVVAFVKMRLIGLEFMELRHAPLPLRLLFEVWVVGVGTAIVALYWLGAR